MTAPPKRRWFSFSLRTMFVVVTVFGVWLGWQLKIVRDRKALLAEISHEQHTLEEMEADPSGNGGSNAHWAADFPFARIPLYRRLLGDKSYPHLVLEATSPQLLERIENAFPEATLDAHVFDKSGMPTRVAWRDSLYTPLGLRSPNEGTLFKTGLIEK